MADVLKGWFALVDVTDSVATCVEVADDRDYLEVRASNLALDNMGRTYAVASLALVSLCRVVAPKPVVQRVDESRDYVIRYGRPHPAGDAEALRLADEVV
jgi:hypothetical protein